MGRKVLVGQVLFGLLGLCVYAYLPVAASRYPAVNWGDPQTLDGFLWEVSGRAYGKLAFGIPLTLIQQRLFAWANLLKEQFGVTGLLVGVIGAVQFPPKDKYIQAGLIWVFTVYSIFAIGYNTADSVAYLIPTYMAFAFWVGRGFAGLWDLRAGSIPLGKVAVALGVILILVRLPGNYREVDPRRDVRPAEFAERYLEAAPPEAILLAESDQDIFPLWYYHFGLDWRPDVRIVVPALAQFAWYRENLVRTYPDLDHPSLDTQGVAAWQAELICLNAGRPVCQSWADTTSPDGIDYSCQPE
jgi:hypothetical protein